MNFIQFINSGSGRGFHAAMLSACLLKFGENPIKKDSTSWAPTADAYANRLLDKFVGVTASTYGPSIAARLFLRTLFAIELGNYFLTNIKNEELTKSIEQNDMYYYSKGYGYNRLLLTQKCN